MTKQSVTSQGVADEVEQSCLNCGHTTYVVPEYIQEEYTNSVGKAKVVHGRYGSGNWGHK